MTKMKLPAATLGARPGLHCEISEIALQRWNPGLQMADEASQDGDVISILDVIGEDFFGEGVSSKGVAAQLRSIGERDVVVNINSPGGNFFEGLAIYNLLRQHKGKVSVRVVGIAASSASVIAMAGDNIEIARAGFLMIHNTWVMAIGDRNELRDTADWLEPFDQTAVDIYAARSGMDVAELGAMLDKETWLSGATCVENGLADELLDSDQVEANATLRQRMEHRVAAHQIDALLAKAGTPRTRRRELMNNLKSDMQNAVDLGKRDAALNQGLTGLLETARRL